MKKLLKSVPGLLPLYQSFQKRRYERHFSTNRYGCFRGIFNTFDEATLSAPKTKSIGYDNPELAQEYVEMLESRRWENRENILFSYDYPVLLWLQSLLNLNHVEPTIFDFGGNVGIHFYAYEKYLKYPANLRWTICDLPEIVKVGETLSAQNNQSKLRFTLQFKDAAESNIFLASGSIQYLENFSKSISQLTQKPKYLLINRLPIYDGSQFVTLQNGGKVFYPQYVFNKTSFTDSLKELGYELIDIWEDHQTSCYIPFHPDRCVSYYHGMFFTLNPEVA